MWSHFRYRAELGFQVPCKAHDYCYDLRKAGFSGTDPDAGCDDQFYWLMWADCEDQVFYTLCMNSAAAIYLAVQPAVTNADPAAIVLRPTHTSGRCAGVVGTTTRSAVSQLSCSIPVASSKKFRIVPASGAPGYFQIKSASSSKCMDLSVSVGKFVQWDCGNYTEQQFEIPRTTFRMSTPSETNGMVEPNVSMSPESPQHGVCNCSSHVFRDY